MDRATNCSPNNEKLPSCSHQCADMSGTLATTGNHLHEQVRSLFAPPTTVNGTKKKGAPSLHHRPPVVVKAGPTLPWAAYAATEVTLEWLPSAEEITGTSADLSEQFATWARQAENYFAGHRD